MRLATGNLVEQTALSFIDNWSKGAIGRLRFLFREREIFQNYWESANFQFWRATWSCRSVNPEDARPDFAAPPS